MKKAKYLFNEKELQKLTGVTRSTLLKWRKYGMPYHYIKPRRLQYDWSQIREWLLEYNQSYWSYVQSIDDKIEGGK